MHVLMWSNLWQDLEQLRNVFVVSVTFSFDSKLLIASKDGVHTSSSTVTTVMS